MSRFVFGETSRRRLATCHPKIRAVMTRAIEITPFDFSIVYGWRDKASQDEAFRLGRSKVRWPDSKHNHVGADGEPLSLAVDIAPWRAGKLIWDDLRLFDVLAGVVFSAAYERGVGLRWGGDFNRNWVLSKDDRFLDYGHFEILE